MEKEEWVEAIGVTKEEALQRALRELKAVRSEVAVEVLEENPHHTIIKVTLKERQKSLEIARAFLQKIVESITPSVEVKVASVDEKEVRYNVVGENLGLLIGKRALTLDAVQLLAEEIFKKLNERRRVLLDVGNYRLRRKFLLRKELQESVQTVLQKGKEVVLDSLSREDREMVYEMLKEFPDVDSRTIGDMNNRKIILFKKERKAE